MAALSSVHWLGKPETWRAIGAAVAAAAANLRAGLH